MRKGDLGALHRSCWTLATILALSSLVLATGLAQTDASTDPNTTQQNATATNVSGIESGSNTSTSPTEDPPAGTEEREASVASSGDEPDGAPSPATEVPPVSGEDATTLREAIRTLRGDALETTGPHGDIGMAPVAPTDAGTSPTAQPSSQGGAAVLPAPLETVSPAWWGGLVVGAVGTLSLARWRRGRDAQGIDRRDDGSPAGREGSDPASHSGTRSSPVPTGVSFQVAIPEDPAPEGKKGRSAVDHPGLPGILLLGQEALRMGEPGIAGAWFETALRLEPGSATANLCYGVCLRELGRPEAAIGRLERASELDPTDAKARLNLARALVEARRHTEAIGEIALLAGADPRVDEALYEDEAFSTLRDHPRFLALVGHL